MLCEGGNLVPFIYYTESDALVKAFYPIVMQKHKKIYFFRTVIDFFVNICNNKFENT